MDFRRIIGIFVLFLVVGAFTGCATVSEPVARIVDPGSVDFYNGDGSGVTSWSALVQDMASASVVLVGEIHRHEKGLGVAAGLWEDILTAAPNAVLSMEFYERDQQLGLDDYMAGVTDRKVFEKNTNRSDGNNPLGHARMIDAAKDAGSMVIAANSPRQYNRLARSQGYDALRKLNATQQAMFTIPDQIPTGSYADRHREIMAGMLAAHGSDSDDSDPGESAAESAEKAAANKEMIEGFLRSQTLWDYTMADSIVRGLQTGSPVVHVVGNFHVNYGTQPGGSGLVDALRPNISADDRIVILMVVDEAPRPLTEDEFGRTDYVVFVGE